MKQKILIIDDELSLQKLMNVTLNAAGYTPLSATTGEEALAAIARHNPTLVLLDLSLPDMSGEEFLHNLREWSNLPVIILTSRDSEEIKISLLEEGADDYVTKPFSTGELLARIKATLRRFETVDIPTSLLQSDNLRLDVANHTVFMDDQELKCTPKEFDLLKLLMKHKGRVLTHTWLLKEVWGVGYQNETQYLRVFIKQLREKIEPIPSRPSRIRTETGIGYRFTE